MKVWATSDLHIDYTENFEWFLNISSTDYTKDILIIAGDIIHDMSKMQQLFQSIVPKFWKVLFVPGNHDIWLMPSEKGWDSMLKFQKVLELVQEEGVQISPFITDDLAIVPLFSWYDFSFGQPTPTIQRAWMDFKACKWLEPLEEIANAFFKMNEAHLHPKSKEIISFAHFLSNPVLIPDRVPPLVKSLIPVFGSKRIEEQLHILKPTLHIYGHSHLNRSAVFNGIWYLNNAFGYPHESHICRKYLVCVYENEKIITHIPQWPQ